jgi:3'(2'), 5'-bisphosphate nucleotidase
MTSASSRGLVGSAELEAMASAAREAAKLVLEVYRTDFQVDYKSVGDPVTRADREANELLIERLSVAFPDAVLVAEESAPSPAELGAMLASPRVIFIDPVDGTREFAARNGEFCVMIGLAERGAPTLGALAFPTTGELLLGEVGWGCVLEEADGTRRRLATSPETNPAHAVAVTSRSRRSATVDAIASSLGIARVVPTGSVGLKVARIAKGEAHVYVHLSGALSKWDACGPDAVLRAAGGLFGGLDGRAYDYSSPSLDLAAGVIATNGPLHPLVVRAVRDRRR